MTKRQIRVALAIVDDVHRLERETRPGALVVIYAPLHLVAQALARKAKSA